jgi:peptidoglycan/xylan/chitin deacetylase (PgdA/CDA1 family)
VQEAARTLEVLAGAGAPRSLLFRPPYGAVTAEKMLRLWADRLQIVLWNVDPRDYAMSNAASLAAFFAAAPLSDGDIVLLHDVHPHAARALPEALARLRERGLSAAALPMPT